MVLQLQRTGYSLGGEDTFESTLFRLSTKRGLVFLLVYVDDLLIAAQNQNEEEVFSFEAPNYLENEGNWIPSRKKGSLEFLGRTIYRSKDGESALYFGVNRQYMTSIFESWGESVKIGGTGIMPKLEDLHKEEVWGRTSDWRSRAALSKGSRSTSLGSAFKSRFIFSNFVFVSFSGETQSCG